MQKEGIIIKTTGSQYTVRCDDGERIICTIKGNLRLKDYKSTNPVAVGDKVVFEIFEDGTGRIIKIHDRHNCIVRRSTKLSKISHILASNVDQIFLIVTVAFPRTSTGFIDRFLVASESFQIPTILVFNKIDIYEESLQAFHDELKQVYEKIGYTCLETSALTGQGIEEMRNRMKNKINAFAGHSGVGKSALANALDNNLNLKTGDISLVHLKGKHTTTFAEMFELSFGGFLIDTPGIKEFGMYNLKKEEIALFFPEMKALLPQCRFFNCTHVHEPGCAVKEALETGGIDPSRYQNYLNIISGQEMEDEEWQIR